MMETMRSYMTERSKIKHDSTGKSPRSIAKAQKQKDVKKAADWRMSVDEMDQLFKMATGVLQHNGGTCKTTPVTHGRAASRRAHAHGDGDKSKDADKSLLSDDKSVSNTRRGGASDCSRRFLTADEDGRAALEDDVAIRAILGSPRSAASARSTQADLARKTFEMQAAAATRAAEATLAAANRHFQLDMMRERRESRESDRRTRVAEQQAMAAVLTAQATLPVDKLRVLKDLYLETRDVAILQQIASISSSDGVASAGGACADGGSIAGGEGSTAGAGRAAASGGAVGSRRAGSSAGGRPDASPTLPLLEHCRGDLEGGGAAEGVRVGGGRHEGKSDGAAPAGEVHHTK
ncbi:hypothetical protein BU14_0066s0016 [Porphyra umbilicalis]|uniref:No apical meristem-associated C-terminal domain-containing protein n=1 Tax=Porphyra umbilicalis TaxID=2786 RepID=A0A1X6PGZ9_PORUM|nr:hypothetical protein BU14_0066s0016 [Porphyra umbilicalis]|eukprot:OSX79963.1 hypothetical protein BU14_0066s0016 [Porphyra umbilicalis]